MGDYPGLSRWTNVITRVLIKGKQLTISEGCPHPVFIAVLFTIMEIIEVSVDR